MNHSDRASSVRTLDPQTSQFYRSRAAEVAGHYEAAGSAASKLFSLAFLPGSRVLDVGCGSGRDVDALIEAGCDAMGIDASEGMLQEALRLRPSLQGRLRSDSLPSLGTVEDGSYDGVLCWSVLMHVPEEHLFDTVFNLRRVLKSGGRLLISTPLQGPQTNPETRRDLDGRLFNGVTPENFRFLFEKVGFRLLNRWDQEDSLGRPERTWATQLFVLEGTGSRSLDRIEAILNRDKKDATYKPALFRALAELATTSYHNAAWLPEGKVAVPIALIADKWLEYFWPLFESKVFIPQKRGEKPGCSKPVAFRAELDELIELYKRQGGLSGFSVDHRSNTLPTKAMRHYRTVRSRLCDTIRAGPVYYAGGGGSGVFQYDSISKHVVMDADLWRELSVMGSWIIDATVLRWAELTAEISQGAIRASQVIDQLLTPPILERDVLSARNLYEGLEDKQCVWTDQPLRDVFEVDHAIPFALWRNNDLWNLLPASRAANNGKRDKLPDRSFLQSRKEPILGYWSIMRDQYPVRFEFEAGKLAGPGFVSGRDWGNRLFGVVAEAVEFTALQRGVERWDPGRAASSRRRRGSKMDAEAGNEAGGSERNGLGLQLLENPPAKDRYVTCVPFYDLAAAAGAFGSEQPAVDPHEHSTWIRVERRLLTKDDFALRVVGRSMEPKIPDGSVALFRGGEALAGSREGRIVLAVLRDGVDPETGGRLTVKRYHSDKVFNEAQEFRQLRIELQPLNPDFHPIVLHDAEEGSILVVGEFVTTIEEPVVHH